MLRQAAISLGYGLCSRLTLFLIGLVAARTLDVPEYGIFSYLLVIVSSIATMSSLGVGMTCNKVASRDYSECPQKVSATLTLSLMASVILAACLTALFVIPLETRLPHYSALTIATTVFVISVLMTSYSALEGIFYGLQMQRHMVFLATLTMALSISASVTLMNLLGLLGAIISLILYRVIALSGFSLQLFRRTSIRLRWTILCSEFSSAKKALVATSIPTAIAGAMAGPVTAFCMGVIHTVHGETELAKFGFMYQFFLMAIFPPGILVHFFLARSVSASNHSTSALYYSLGITASYGCAAAVLFNALNILTPVIAPSIPVDSLMIGYFSASVLFSSLNYSFNAYWTAVDRAAMVPITQAVWAIIVIGTTILFSEGGAFTVSAGFAVGALAQLAANVVLYAATRRRTA